VLGWGAAVVIAAGALAPFLGWAAIPVAAAVVLLLGAVARLAIGAKRTSLEDSIEQASLDARLRVPVGGVDTIEPTAIGVEPASQDILPGAEWPDYLPRARDADLGDAVEQALEGTGRWIVALCGPSKAGKSRSLFEALLSCAERRQIRVVAPVNGDAIRSLMAPGHGVVERGKDHVVWLDDLEVFIDGGVDLDMLRTWHQRDGVVFVATYGGKGSDRLTGDAEGLAVLADSLLQHSAQINLGNTTAAELDQLPRDVSAGSRREIEQHGLAAMMVAAPTLERVLTSKRHGIEAASPAGAALVSAAIDWARCGRTDPLDDETLGRLGSAYLDGTTELSGAALESALEWALKPVSGTISLLRREDGGYLAFDYIVSFVAEGKDFDPPPDPVWDCALDTDDPVRSFNVGVVAHDFERSDYDVPAMRAASLSSNGELAGLAQFNLGTLMEREDDLAAAEDAYRAALALGHAMAARNLGVLLANREEKTEAEAIYRRGVELGDPGCSSNLGVLLIESGDVDGAEEAFKQGDEEGRPVAAMNLAKLLQDHRGDAEGAEAAYRRAAERGDVIGMTKLAGLLEERGAIEEAESFYRLADEAGSAAAAVNLGAILVDRGEAKDAAKAFRRAVERGELAGALNLGLLLVELGDEDGAVDLLKTATTSENEEVASRANETLRLLDDRRED